MGGRLKLGQILVSKGDDDTEIFFPAYYSSTCGGHTEDCENVFGESFPALKGVPCQYCKNVARPRFFFWPIVRIDKQQVTAGSAHLVKGVTQLHHAVLRAGHQSPAQRVVGRVQRPGQLNRQIGRRPDRPRRRPHCRQGEVTRRQRQRVVIGEQGAGLAQAAASSCSQAPAAIRAASSLGEVVRWALARQ